MATYGKFVNQYRGIVAGADLSAVQYKPVKINSTGVAVASVAQEGGAGAIVTILQNDPESGQAALLPGPGSHVKAVAGANDIASGEFLTANSSGVVDTTTGFVFARALEASAAVGDYIEVELVTLKL